MNHPLLSVTEMIMIACLILLSEKNVRSQNLAINWSFEEYSSCPAGYGNGGALQCQPWVCGSLGTADYLNACDVNENSGVPENFGGFQYARTGVAYTGIYNRININYEYREYIQSPLLEPLVAGTVYHVSFYVNLTNYSCATSRMGAHLSALPPPVMGIEALDVVPQIESTLGFLTDTLNWMYISGCFVAAGGEQYITIGNFYPVAETPPEGSCPPNNQYSYYYIDDVTIIAVPEEGIGVLELGSPVTSCNPVLIESNITDVAYSWSTGEETPDITVTSSGTYYLTVTGGCDFNQVQIDSVVVTILGSSDPVDIPEESYTLCDGNTYSISLDPAAGMYSWNDGSSGPEYLITTAGTYQVTLDDGCDLSSDEVTVVLDFPPDPISLGPDTSLCPNEEVELILDPLAGDFTWQDNSTDNVFTIQEEGTYSVTVSNMCGSVSDDIYATYLNFPIVDIGVGVLELCLGDVYTILLDPDIGDYVWQDGTQGPQYSISTEGEYAVTVSNQCGSDQDEIAISILPPPSFSLGDDIFLCLGTELAFSFDPALGDFLWQDGNSSSSYIINEGGTYTLTISNSCGEDSDEIIITDLGVPDVEIGPDDLTICEGENIVIEIDPALGDILWQDGTSTPVYEITDPGFYSVFVTNQCGTGSDQVAVFVVTPPSVNLGSDTTICLGETLLLTSDQEGTFVWQDNSTADSFLIISPGVFSLSVTNFCGITTDSIIVGYSPLITPPDLGPDLSLCPGADAVLFATTPGASYLWSNATTADSLFINTPGTYSVEVFNACTSFTDTVVVTVDNNPPQVDLPDQLTLCQGQTLTLDAAISGVSFLWNDNSSNQQLVISAPGTYTLTVTNACGADSDTTIILDGGPAPVVDIGNDLQICAGDVIPLFPSFSNVDAWIWNDGSTLPSFVVSSAGIISVQVNNACGLAFDTMLVSLSPATPPLDLGADTSLCTGESFTLSITTPAVTILWPDGSTATNYNVTGTGIVFAEISNSCGTSFDTMLVNALPDVPALNLGIDQSLCPGEIITLTPGIPNVQYLWQDGSTSNSYQSTLEETIILIISNECNSISDTLEIIESTQGPQVDLGNDIQVCAGETVTIQSGISGVSYLWQDGATTPAYTTNQSGVFILTVNNSCGADTDTIAVDISGVPPAPVLGPDTTLCEGITLLLISSADAETSIEWQDGSSAPTYTVSSPGTYTLAESNRCGDAADTMTVDYLDAPDPFTLGPDTTLCPGESISLSTPSTAYEIRWQDGSTQPTIIADQAQTYSLQLSNDCGDVSDNIVVDFDTRVPLLNLDPSISWCEGDIISLDASQPFVAGYLWNDGSSTPAFQVTAPGLYSIEVTTPCSIIAQDVDVYPGTDCVVPKIHAGIHIPNVFSPDGDGINDVFTVSFGSDLEITAMEGTIFDRWGNLVFGSKDIPFNWDGFFNKEPVMPGVYAFVIRIEYLLEGDSQQKSLYGDVTVVR